VIGWFMNISAEKHPICLLGRILESEFKEVSIWH